MTTVEMQLEHLQERNKTLTAEVSRLEGERHGLELEREQLLADAEYFKNFDNKQNLIIADLQQQLFDVEQG